MNGKKLLVADDSLTIQKVIRLALSNEGYEILAVSNGSDTLQQISLSHPDVVLIDIKLPGKSAFEVKKWANSQPDLASTRFILLSSAFEAIDEQQLSTLGFQGRLTKPFDPAHLRSVLTQVLGRTASEPKSPPPRFPAPPPSLQRPPSAPPPPPPGRKPMLTPPPVAAPAAPVREPVREPLQKPVHEPALPEFLSTPLPAEESSVEITGSIELGPPSWEAPAEPQVAEQVMDPLWAEPEAPARRPDADIRELTESTIRMSGLDDFDWSMNEQARKEEPLLPPPGKGLSDFGDSTFRFDAPLDPPSPGRAEELPPLPTFDPPPAPDSPAYSYHSAPETVAPFSFEAQSTPEPQTLAEPQWDASRVEELVQQQVQAALEKMTRQLLPEIAERIIRQEIRRMLSDQQG